MLSARTVNIRLWKTNLLDGKKRSETKLEQLLLETKLYAHLIPGLVVSKFNGKVDKNITLYVMYNIG